MRIRKPARDVIGVETISSSLRAKVALENVNEIRVKVIFFNDQRDFYCRATWQNGCEKWM